jgi:hypothetical protein
MTCFCAYAKLTAFSGDSFGVFLNDEWMDAYGIGGFGGCPAWAAWRAYEPA